MHERHTPSPANLPPPAASIPPSADPTPSFAPPARATAASAVRTRLRLLEMAVLIALAILLAVQWLVASRNDLAADARWRAVVAPLCGVLGCRVPDWRQPEAFHLIARDVQPHPARAGVLRITATFRNEAAWPQPWPALVVQLTGSDGAVVGARAFTPREYLGAQPEQRLIAPGQPVSLAVDVRQPDARAVAFDFTLR